MIKNYKVYGTNVDPRSATVSDKILVKEGIFAQTASEQSVYLSSRGLKYRYYILEAVDTYGGNVALQEWAMYERSQDYSKRVVSQIRLRPVSFDSNEEYFPKQIEIYGSNDLLNWTSIASFDTFTPFRDYYTYGRWQRYSFFNDSAYFAYKINFSGNWGGSQNIFKIAEWEMVENVIEDVTYRVLGGTTNNVHSVWADTVSSYDDGHTYIANEAVNTILNFSNALYNSTTISGSAEDINVMI
jgi:hypothetical protein